MYVTRLPREPGRSELGAFLKSRRERVLPEMVGLLPGARRRTPGLRREEVAQLAGVGLTWYTWLEQGREINVSAHVLERISQALRMDRAERAHLYALARRTPPPAALEPVPATRELLHRVVATITAPAYVITTRWDIVAMNAPAVEVFGDLAMDGSEYGNLLWLVFMDKRFQTLLPDWKNDTRRIVAKFRLDYGNAKDDKSFEALVANLKEASPYFERLWRQHDVHASGEGMKRLRMPDATITAFDYASFLVGEHQQLRLVVYLPDEARRG
jgi:transcriptional regulator with XRE-family HTH domain